MSNEFYLSRQPVLSAERRFIGWDVRLGSVEGEELSPTGDTTAQYEAAAEEIIRGANLGVMCAGGNAILHAGRRLVFSDLIERMPRGQVWLALPQLDEVDANLANRLYELSSRLGLRIILLGYERRDVREQLIDLAEAVQIDWTSLEPDARDALARRAHRRKVRVLATGVDEPADFSQLAAEGFDLFGGASPMRTGEAAGSISNEHVPLLLELLLESMHEVDIDPFVRRLSAEPDLADALLRLVNSLELARAQKIEELGQALIMIGGKGLARWLTLLLFQVEASGGGRGPLFRVAAGRARLMELIATARESDGAAGKTAGEAAFLAGILSLVPVLLGEEREQAITKLGLSEPLHSALCRFEGELGLLLRFVERLDEGAFPEVAAVARELELSCADVWAHQNEAWAWVEQML